MGLVRACACAEPRAVVPLETMEEGAAGASPAQREALLARLFIRRRSHPYNLEWAEALQLLSPLPLLAAMDRGGAAEQRGLLAGQRRQEVRGRLRTLKGRLSLQRLRPAARCFDRKPLSTAATSKG